MADKNFIEVTRVLPRGTETLYVNIDSIQFLVPLKNNRTKILFINKYPAMVVKGQPNEILDGHPQDEE